MVNKKLFIEGTSETTNGDLRVAFGKLLEQKLKGKMPRIKMGDSKKATINAFKNYSDSKDKFLLIDLDSSKENRDIEIDKNDLSQEKQFVFFMIQEMEAWFLSHPEILDKYYNLNIGGKIKNKNPEDIDNPSKKLEKWTKGSKTRGSKKGKYHKTKHGVQLLLSLNAEKLEECFSDFRNLIGKLSK